METEKQTPISPEGEAMTTGEESAALDESGRNTEMGEDPSPAADAGQQETVETGTEPARLSWEQILRDPEYKSRFDAAVQGIVKGRLRGRHEAEQRLERLAPVLRALEESYGLSDEADISALAERLRDSAGFRRPDGGEIAAHLDAMLAEAESLRRSVPDFDLLRELEDPVFLRMTAPHSGVGVADAYFARHRAERERETARQSLEAVSRSLRSLGARPRELRDTGTPASYTADPRQMTRQEREALKRRILEAGAQGRKLGIGE